MGKKKAKGVKAVKGSWIRKMVFKSHIFFWIHPATDSAYTERYMGLPNVTDNYKAYDESDLTKVADMLRDKHFMMVSFIKGEHGEHTFKN